MATENPSALVIPETTQSTNQENLDLHDTSRLPSPLELLTNNVNSSTQSAQPLSDDKTQGSCAKPHVVTELERVQDITKQAENPVQDQVERDDCVERAVRRLCDKLLIEKHDQDSIDCVEWAIVNTRDTDQGQEHQIQAKWWCLSKTCDVRTDISDGQTQTNVAKKRKRSSSQDFKDPPKRRELRSTKSTMIRNITG